MTNSDGLTLTLWPRGEPFAYGVFQVHPHPRLAVHVRILFHNKLLVREEYQKASVICKVEK